MVKFSHGLSRSLVIISHALLCLLHLKEKAHGHSISFCCFSLAHPHSTALPTLIGCGQILFSLSFSKLLGTPFLVFLTSISHVLCIVLCVPHLSVSTHHQKSSCSTSRVGVAFNLLRKYYWTHFFNIKLNHASYLVDQSFSIANLGSIHYWLKESPKFWSVGSVLANFSLRTSVWNWMKIYPNCKWIHVEIT